ncbi:hypothetical protein [Flavobacterium reichenbachii]|uniref:hypothetical protein n=1 Tax=Flavobacterium reichenbachii TaxID=362418 RepID=UPI000F4F8215|nr:hypothetical protein [Flavobacterium reichenbachii]
MSEFCTNLITNLLTYLNALTVGCFIIFAIISLFLQVPAGRSRDLEYIINKGLAGSALPTGLALLGCAFKPELLTLLDGVSLNVAVAGITLLFISYKAVFTS